MASVSDHAPLFVDSLALAQWLSDKFDQAPGVLGPSLCRCALVLVQAVTLALKDRRREEQIELADEQLIRLRVLLRLAVDSGRLNTDQYAFVLDKVDVIGRQLGGWRRSLGAL
jgi:hypothetical protein